MSTLISLDGTWQLATDPDNAGRQQQWQAQIAPNAVPAPVPGIIQAPFPAYHGVAWYWRTFAAPANPHPRGRCLLRCWAVDYLAEVWVNGVPVGGHEGGETPFVLDITGALQPGENLLAIRVLNPTNEPIDGIVLAQTPHRNKSLPHHTGGSYNYGGIMESVELLVAPAVRLADLFVRAEPQRGVLRVQVETHNTTDQPLAGQLQLSVAPAAGGETLMVSELPVELQPGQTRIDTEIHLVNAHLWSLEDPFLYRVSAQLQTSMGADEQAVRCGFRDFCVEGGYFRLNGRRLFVRSTHTGNHAPVGQVNAPASAPDLLRRDLLYAKVCGYNMVRFIAGMAHPHQLDLCDEIGLLVYEESLAGWCLADSPEMGARFDFSTREMVLRDRNHPSVVVWGLLNETQDTPVFRHAHGQLPLVRQFDDSRLVLLNSSRWDGQWSIGSVCNPGSHQWEYVWGQEAPGAPPAGDHPLFHTQFSAYRQGSGDVHLYPPMPAPAEVEDFVRRVGHDSKPVFLSEYGTGSLMNALRELRCYEQSGENMQVEDAQLMRSMAEAFSADWQAWGFDGVYAFPEDMLRHSQQLHGRQRLLNFDLIRSNPKIVGYNLTGMLDHGMTGEGIWTFWREWKPGAFDALSDGWAPVRWCLFSRPLHGYLGRPLALEAVLASEDMLPPGEYPARFRLLGPEGLVWEECTSVQMPAPTAGEERPLAVPALQRELRIDGPEGTYTFAANIERGAAPAGGRLRIHLSRELKHLRLKLPLTLCGVAAPAETWLQEHGVECQPFSTAPAAERELILVGATPPVEVDFWRVLLEKMDRGAAVLFADPAAFARGQEPLGWLPLADKGQCPEFWDWLYHKECVAKNHPVFAGLQAGGILDWDYWKPVLPSRLFTGQAQPGEVLAAAFAIGYPCAGGYSSGVLLSAHRFGAGAFLLNTFPVLEHLGAHPAADRLLANLLTHTAAQARKTRARPSRGLAAQLRALGPV
ncbi:MAG: hypothetical protein IT369_04870 [Candidatus Latescibacteria bacterium]|nr:hypothetical protein [Candidatus Latescibacterota bacterium]